MSPGLQTPSSMAFHAHLIFKWHGLVISTVPLSHEPTGCQHYVLRAACTSFLGSEDGGEPCQRQARQREPEHCLSRYVVLAFGRRSRSEFQVYIARPSQTTTHRKRGRRAVSQTGRRAIIQEPACSAHAVVWETVVASRLGFWSLKQVTTSNLIFLG